MTHRFFLSPDTLAELRERGIVPLSYAALRWTRVGALLFTASFISWSELSAPGFEMLLLFALPALLVLTLGLAATKLYFSALPTPPLADPHPITAPWITALVYLGVVLSAIALILSTDLVPAFLYQITLLAKGAPESSALVLRSALRWIGIGALVVGAALAGAEILFFHYRHRPAAIKRTE